MKVLGINHGVNSTPSYRGSKTNVQTKNINKNIQTDNKRKSTYLIGAGAVATVAVAGLAIAGHKGKGPLKKIFAQFNKVKNETKNVQTNPHKPEIKPEIQPEVKTQTTPETKIEPKAEVKTEVVEIKPKEIPAAKPETKAEPKSEPKVEVKSEKETAQADTLKTQTEAAPKINNDKDVMAEIQEYLKDKEIVTREQKRPNGTLFVLYKNTKKGEPVSETMYRQFGERYEHNDYDPRTKFPVKKTTYQEDGKTIESVTTYHPNSSDKKELIKYHEDGITIKQKDSFASGYEHELLDSKSFDKKGVEIV